MNWLAIFQGLAGGLAMLGGGQIILALMKRRVDTTDMAVKLNASALEYAEDLKRTTADAMKEASEARREASQARREMSTVRQEAEKLADYLGWIVRNIQDPHMDIDRLRVLVGSYGPPNRQEGLNGH